MNANDIITREQYNGLTYNAKNKIPYDFGKTVKQGKTKITVRMYSYVGRNIASIEFRHGESVSGGTMRNVIEYNYDEFCDYVNDKLERMGILEKGPEQFCLW